MVKTLENQTIVIFGGSAGIGYGVAKHLLETTKANVIIGSSTAKRVEDAVSSLSQIDGAAGRITGHAVNLDVSTSETSIAQFFNTVGPFNHLIYTAADSLQTVPITEISKEKGDKADAHYVLTIVATNENGEFLHEPGSSSSSCRQNSFSSCMSYFLAIVGSVVTRQTK